MTDESYPLPIDDEPRAGVRADLARLAAHLARGAAPQDATPTGYPSVDALLGGGLRRGDLVVLAGDTGSGKSALALSIALRAAASGRATAFLTGEASPDRVHERIFAIEGRLSLDELRRPTRDQRVRDGIDFVVSRDTPLPLIDRLPLGGVGGISDYLLANYGTDLVIVDPAEALAIGGRAPHEELAETARTLKSLALRHHCTVLVTTLTLPPTTEDRRPTLGDLGGLGAMRQHADVVLGLFREELYTSHPDIDGAAELRVLKNRHGSTGYADLYFYKSFLRFEDMVE